MSWNAALSLALATGLIAAANAVRVAELDALARDRRNAMALEEDVLRSPGPEVLQIAAMEHPNMWADLLWLQIVQELGKPAEGEQASYDRLQRWSNIAVDLDNRYYQVYWASAIHLIAYAKRARAAERLLLKGRQFLPEIWELPFLLGYVHYFLLGDPGAASAWWETATHLPHAPRFLPSLAARSRVHTGDEQGAIELLEAMLPSLEGVQKEDAEIRLKILRSEPVLREYDDACRRFLAERGRRPESGEELYREKYTTAPPFDMLDQPIRLDETCRARTEIIFVRDDEAKARVGQDGVSPEDE